MRDDLLFPTIRQAARRGPLSERSLRMMLKQGKLPGFYVGNHFRVNYSMLQEKLRADSIKAIKEEEE